jgi:large subunit ribosomal protein L35
MRRPKGIKTKKSVSKRFKITATGKVLRSKAGKRHLMQHKSSKRRRSLSGGGNLVHERDVHRITGAMPFSHRG